MMTRVLLALFMALGFLLATPAVAHADPVTAAIVGTVFTAGTTSFAVASFVVNTAMSYGLSRVAGALTKRKQSSQERQASVNTLSLGEAPREAIFGLACTGGSLVDVFNWGGQYGTNNVTYCIALADHACDGMQGFYVDDVYYPWTGNGPQAAFSGKLTLEFRNAHADGWAPPSVATANGGWTATDRGVGVTHIWVTIDTTDDKVWPQGLPRLKWVVRGLRPFDPRRQDHNPADPTTWTFSRNPILERYAYARGVYVTGRHGQPEHLLIGRGLSVDEAPVNSRLIAAANLCDEHVDGVSRYYADGVVSADMNFVTVEELFASAVAGVIVQREGGVEIEPGQAKAAVVTITDDDLVVGESVEFEAFLPDTEGGRINTVVPRYISPAHGYVDHSGPVRRVQADIERDRGPRELTLALPMVTGGEVADRNAEIARRLARLEKRATITLPPEFSRLEEGDWIAWRSDRRHGGATVRYRIESWGLNEAWRMRAALREIAASVFGQADPIEDQAQVPPPPVPIDALQLFGVTAEAITLAGDEATSTLPAVRFRWDAADAAVRSIRAEIRRVGEAETSSTVTQDVAAGALVTTNGVGPGQGLECRLVPIGEPSRPVLAGAWMTVTTGSLIAGDVSQDSPVWAGIQGNALDLLDKAINDARALFDEEQRRGVEVEDTLKRLGIGLLIDPVAQTAIIRTSTIAQAVGPNFSNETLVQMSLRLVAADAANTAAVAQALIDGRAYTDSFKSEAALTFATYSAMNGAISASALSIQSWTTGQISSATINLVSGSQLGSAISNSETSLRSWTNGQISTAVGGLASTASVAASLATAKGQWESYAEDAASRAIIGLDSVAGREAALAIARGQWESYASQAAASAVVGLVSGAQLASSLATAKGQWESYADAASANAIVGLDSVAAREAAVAASALSLQGWVGANYATSSALVATQTTLGETSARAYLALSTAQGNEAYAALTADVNGRLTAMRINGVSRAVDFLADYFNVTSGPGGGIGYSASSKLFKIHGDGQKTVLKASGGIRFWSGSSSVADGAETAENGVLALGPGVPGGGQYNGLGLAGPFSTGSSGSIVIAASPTWTTVGWADLYMRNGVAMAEAMWEATLSPVVHDVPPALLWRFVLLSGPEIASGQVTGIPGSQGMSIPIQRMSFGVTGVQQLIFQLSRHEPSTEGATINNARARGLYAPYATWA